MRKKNNHTLYILHFSLPAPTYLLFVMVIYRRVLHLLNKKISWCDSLSCPAVWPSCGYNERWGRDFPLIQVPPVPRSVPQGSNMVTLIITCMLWWPDSQTKRLNAEDYSCSLGFAENQRQKTLGIIPVSLYWSPPNYCMIKNNNNNRKLDNR